MSRQPSKFLQIHTLTSYPGSLLNRDDAGFAKRLPFGGVSRIRVSSQCLKRHWRRFQGEHSLARVLDENGNPVPLSVRSRVTFDREIRRPLVEGGESEERARAATEALLAAVLQVSPGRAKKAEEDESADDKALHTGQVTVLGRPEVDFFLQVAREALAAEEDPKAVAKAIQDRFKKEERKNLLALLDAGLDAAVFGRMVTSDVLARCDAALHVAHAFTVHGEEAEDDYFSAVDDLLAESGETGSGHINTTELTSGLFYGYVVVDVPLLVSNLTGCPQGAWADADPKLAREVVRRIVHLIATVSPGAKLGSTAPYAYAQMMLVEAGAEAPRTLANAFLKPVSTQQDVVSSTYRALADHLEELDEVYGAPGGGRKALALGPKDQLGDRVGPLTSLSGLAQWAAEQVAP